MLSDLTASPEWRDLQKRAAYRQSQPISDDVAYPEALTCGMLRFDFSHHLCGKQDFDGLLALAKRQDVMGWRQRMADGDAINISEKRAVRHMDLRSASVDIVERELNKMKNLAHRIRTDGRFKHVVNIGVGGSDLGPRMVARVFDDIYPTQPIQTHYIANVDGADFARVTAQLEASETLFILCSKSMTTMETLANGQLAKDWLLDNGVTESDVDQHFIAVSQSNQIMDDMGIAQEARLELWDWVGGRYSLWSSIGVSIAIGYGFDVFKQLLAGAHAMDYHFMHADTDKNAPIISALLGIWYRNFMGAAGWAVHPYSQSLSMLVPYLQQLDMESNGKSVSRNGVPLDYCTSPIVFGQVGSNGQHAFFQMMHQGSDMIPSEFIGIKAPVGHASQHQLLLANMDAQIQSLAQGRSNDTEPHRHFAGNRPSTCVMLDELNAHALGMLLAYYEHRTFVQGVIWDVNSFDQWGVELGKSITKDILAQG